MYCRIYISYPDSMYTAQPLRVECFARGRQAGRQATTPLNRNSSANPATDIYVICAVMSSICIRERLRDMYRPGRDTVDLLR